MRTRDQLWPVEEEENEEDVKNDDIQKEQSTPERGSSSKDKPEVEDEAFATKFAENSRIEKDEIEIEERETKKYLEEHTLLGRLRRFFEK